MFKRLSTFVQIYKIEQKVAEYYVVSLEFSSVQLLSHVQFLTTLWTAPRQASLSITKSPSLLKLMSFESMTPSNYLILCSAFSFISVHPFSSWPSIFLSTRVFSKSQFFASGGQNIGGSASVLPMNIQDWSLLAWTGWISLQCKGLWRVLSNSTVQKSQFFSAQLSLWSNSHISTWLLEKP